jgi:ADP-ribose pyrophosphatase YjhB (NUDIX family)
MADDVITVYLDQQPPESWNASIFLVMPQGPESTAAAWHRDVVALLREQWPGGGPLVVFVPRPSSQAGRSATVTELADWYDRALHGADVVLFWWPEALDPGLLPQSLAAWSDGLRVIHGAPHGVAHARDLQEHASGQAVTAAPTLAAMVGAALEKIGSGAHRSDGERDVPLPLWRAESFQRWYSAQTMAGNKLLGARQVWTFSIGPRRRLLYWALHVRIYVLAEDRIKDNEIVISRPDISVLALYRRGVTIDDTSIVLVREFRSPASTPDGMVHELPGGSGVFDRDARDQAVQEAAEETGLVIDASRIRAHGSRQVAATVSGHHAHLFTAEITSAELARLRASSATPRGSTYSEQTWPEIMTFAQIRRSRLVDWATLGMIAEAIIDVGPSR